MTEISALWAEFELLRLKDQSAAITKKEPKRRGFICKYCNGVQSFNSDGLPTCMSCGIVEDYIDDGAEWVSNVDETGRVSDPARCGAPKDLELFSEQWGSSTILKPTGRSTWRKNEWPVLAFICL